MKLKIAAKVDRADVDYFERKIKPLLNHPLVEFMGEIGHREKGDFLGNAAALLFPINWPEPFGLVMIEAMACGTPVIAYPYGSVPEIIPRRRMWILWSTMSKKASMRFIASAKLTVTTCRRHFELNFTAERMARDYVKIYQTLVDPQPASLSLEEGVLNWMEAESSTPSTT